MSFSRFFTDFNDFFKVRTFIFYFIENGQVLIFHNQAGTF